MLPFTTNLKRKRYLAKRDRSISKNKTNNKEKPKMKYRNLLEWKNVAYHGNMLHDSKDKAYEAYQKGNAGSGANMKTLEKVSVPKKELVYLGIVEVHDKE